VSGEPEQVPARSAAPEPLPDGGGSAPPAAIAAQLEAPADDGRPEAPLEGGRLEAPSEPAQLIERAREISRLAERRWARAPKGGLARERARQLHEHVRSYILPRARSLDAPLLVVLLGSTGAGKSTLLNTIAGRRVSRTGVLRPTTREAVLLATGSDSGALLEPEGSLASVPRGRLELAEGAGARPGLALADAPDIDSVERDNRALADVLVEAADLCVFVTTGTRYADRVPWDVLHRVRQRGLPLIVVVNRLPPDAADAEAVLEDVERLMSQAGLGDETRDRLEIVGVREGELDPEREGLRPETVAPIIRRIDELSADRESRRRLAAQALAGAIAGLGPLVHEVADDLEHEAIDADALHRIAHTTYAEEFRALESELRGGRFLREEVLRNWQAFVGADQVTRLFSSGIGRIRGAILTLLRGTPPAPIAVVEQETTSDLVAISLSHAAEAARRTAARWSEREGPADLLAADASLWSPSADFAERLEGRLRSWMQAIADDVRNTGGPKRALAQGASIGVNALGVAVMLGVFSQTGGLTGAEVGIAAATAFLNQKLLQALFGEAAMVEMIDRARQRLSQELEATLAEDRARFERLVPRGAELRALATELRTSVDQLAA
jgi:energy-coupling factor transporter ATP-binding protein EcfA2